MALTPAQKQKAYRDRKRAIKMAPILAARRAQEELDRAKAEVARLEREARELAQKIAQEAAERAEQARVQAAIASGELSPDGDPWRPDEPVVCPNTPTSARAQVEAGRRAALQAAVDSFNKSGALAPDPLGPRARRPDTLASRYVNPWAEWHKDY